MECGDCISVDTLMKQKNCWTEDALREIASGCLLGLEYLHKKGIAHGVSE